MKKDQRKYQQVDKAVKSINQEYFNSFVIFATDLEGNVHLINNIVTQADELALLSMVAKFQHKIEMKEMIQDDLDGSLDS